MTVHVFFDDLAESLKYNGTWDSYYSTIWGDQIISVESVEDLSEQKQGIDRKVHLKSGQTITIDEKHRREDYGDLLLELWHIPDETVGEIKPGWAIDWSKRCDYIAYCIIPSNTCHLIPFDALRRTVRKHSKRWATEQGKSWKRYARNRGYRTLNIAVPFREFHRCLAADSMSVWGHSPRSNAR